MFGKVLDTPRLNLKIYQKKINFFESLMQSSERNNLSFTDTWRWV